MPNIWGFIISPQDDVLDRRWRHDRCTASFNDKLCVTYVVTTKRQRRHINQQTRDLEMNIHLQVILTNKWNGHKNYLSNPPSKLSANRSTARVWSSANDQTLLWRMDLKYITKRRRTSRDQIWQLGPLLWRPRSFWRCFWQEVYLMQSI